VIAADLLATLLWPMVAITLVLCGMTLASGGRDATPAPDRRGSNASAGGRRATDRLPGERTMVVVTGDASADTIRRAMTAARGHDAAASRTTWEASS
jgi:hypothetical protein